MIEKTLHWILIVMEKLVIVMALTWINEWYLGVSIMTALVEDDMILAWTGIWIAPCVLLSIIFRRSLCLKIFFHFAEGDLDELKEDVRRLEEWE